MKKFIAVLDVGSTNIKCFIYDNRLQVVGNSMDRIKTICPERNYCEIDPEELWQSVINVVDNAIRASDIPINKIVSFGISSQRGTFITWNRRTMKPYHNFISWKDLRADKLVQSWNNSFIFKVTLRLLWMLKNCPALKTADKNELMFGTIDTWLLYRLTGGKTYLTDYSCASGTGMFDPFNMKWAQFLSWVGVRAEILPSVCQSAGFHFGSVVSEIWGIPIPITCVMADQMASLYGCGCFEVTSTKITIGTGGFLDINIGSSLRMKPAGLYPLVGWVTDDEVIYVMEGGCCDVGFAIEWAQSANLFGNDELPSLSDDAFAVQDSDEVYFVPRLFQLQSAQTHSLTEESGFIGIKPTTARNYIIRSVLESIVFKMYQVYDVCRADITCWNNIISIDGGVSKNDFVCQSLADLIELPLRRFAHSESTSCGVAFMAGLSAGVWKDKEEIKRYRKTTKIFMPDAERRKVLLVAYNKWKKAVDLYKDQMGTVF